MNLLDQAIAAAVVAGTGQSGSSIAATCLLLFDSSGGGIADAEQKQEAVRKKENVLNTRCEMSGLLTCVY